MKCSSRRNCDLVNWPTSSWRWCLNEVQFPKELRGSARRSLGGTITLPQ